MSTRYTFKLAYFFRNEHRHALPVFIYINVMIIMVVDALENLFHLLMQMNKIKVCLIQLISGTTKPRQLDGNLLAHK